MSNSLSDTSLSQPNLFETIFDEFRSLIFLFVIALIILGLISLDTGFSGVILFCLGALLGGVFLYFQYGFASGWRNFLVHGHTMQLSSHFCLAAICAFIFIPAELWGIDASGSVAPVSISLFIGAFLFGIGMQLANGCGSGVLFSFGASSGRMILALPFFIVGSVIGSIILPPVLLWGSLGNIVIGGGLSTELRTIINILLLSSVSIGFYLLGYSRDQKLPPHLIFGTLIIALLCCTVFILSGHPWGVTFGFTLWGAKALQALGLTMTDFTFWTWPGPKRALELSVLSNISSLMDIGMIIGAGITAAVAGKLKNNEWPGNKQLLAAAIGGLAMGIGARLSFGCNIGAFLAGTASGSLHGWIWFGMALAGSWIGLKLRPFFGFKINS